MNEEILKVFVSFKFYQCIIDGLEFCGIEEIKIELANLVKIKTKMIWLYR